MASPVVDLRGPRPRRPARRESVRVLHVIAGPDPAEGEALSAEVVTASRGRVALDRVVGLGCALDHMRLRAYALVLLQARHLDVARVALGELRRGHPAVPVILLTADADDASAVGAVRAGAEDCLASHTATGSGLVRAVLCALERTSHAETLRTQAVTDPLTGLANRHALQTSIDHALATARRKGRGLAVLFVDLDGFKDINDAHGHEAGDGVLREIARRFVSRTRDMDSVARLGGDEFVVVMEDLDDSRFAATLATKLLTAAAAPLDLGGTSVTLTASVGISVFPGDGDDAAALIRHADTAMYAAKTGGRSQFRYYRARMNEHSRARSVLRGALAEAVERDDLALHFQPVWQASRRRISSCEALLRWRRPGHGLVAPDTVLEVAEESGLLAPITARLVDGAGAMARRMRDAGFTVPVSLNLSQRQILDGDAVAQLTAAVQRYGLEPSALQIEIRESVLADVDPRVQRALADLTAAGLALVVDDFGSGVSSLRALSRVRPAAIKLDGTLVRELPAGVDATALVRAVIALASSLGLRVVAEGVETEDQARHLRALGCDDLQGYYYGHALPADEWLAYLRWAVTAVVGTDAPSGPRLAVARAPRAEAGPRVGDRPRVSGAALPRRSRGRVVVGAFRTS